MAQDPKTRGFLIHLAAYLAVNIVLAAVNLATAPDSIWFIWPLIGWGIGVAAHGLALLLQRRGPRAGLLADPDARGFVVHGFVYLAVNVLLIVVDLTTSPGAQWFYWPLLGWGIGLAAHGIFAWRSARSRRDGTGAAAQG